MQELTMKIDGDRLKAFRSAKGWTQQHLSDVSGLSLRTIQRAESTGQVSHETLKSLAATFETDQAAWLPGHDRSKRLQTGWEVAGVVMAVTHLLCLALVWLFTGDINTLLIKLMIVCWVVLLVAHGTMRLTPKRQGLDSWDALQKLNASIRRDSAK